MLRISRKVNQSFILTVPGFEPIEIKVVDIKGSQVAIAVQADKKIGIWREEIYPKLLKEAGSPELMEIKPGKSWKEES